ncbi:hypothetical protein AGLY_002273, partial [Aphis glycines]
EEIGIDNHACLRSNHILRLYKLYKKVTIQSVPMYNCTSNARSARSALSGKFSLQAHTNTHVISSSACVAACVRVCVSKVQSHSRTLAVCPSVSLSVSVSLCLSLSLSLSLSIYIRLLLCNCLSINHNTKRCRTYSLFNARHCRRRLQGPPRRPELSAVIHHTAVYTLIRRGLITPKRNSEMNLDDRVSEM